jgi:hypothetical protein
MKCPSCACAAADDAVECPGCGLIFAKWKERERERKEQEKRAASDALAALEVPAASSAPPNPWVGRGIAAGAVALWLGAFGVYLIRHTHKHVKDLGADTGAFVERRDPKTGDMKRMPIMRVGGAPGPSNSEPPAEIEPVTAAEPAPSSEVGPPLVPPSPRR